MAKIPACQNSAALLRRRKSKPPSNSCANFGRTSAHAAQRSASRKHGTEKQRLRKGFQRASHNDPSLLKIISLRTLVPLSRHGGMTFFRLVHAHPIFAILIFALMQASSPAFAQKGFYKVSNLEPGTKVFLN